MPKTCRGYLVDHEQTVKECCHSVKVSYSRKVVGARLRTGRTVRSQRRIVQGSFLCSRVEHCHSEQREIMVHYPAVLRSSRQDAGTDNCSIALMMYVQHRMSLVGMNARPV